MNAGVVYIHQHEALPCSSGLVRVDPICRCILRCTAPPHSDMDVTVEGWLISGRSKIIHPRWHRSHWHRLNRSLHAESVVGCYATSSGQVHHGGMMRGGSGGKIGGRRVGCDDFYSKQIHISTDHGGRRRPTATMGPHSWFLTIQRQCANILWNRPCR